MCNKCMLNMELLGQTSTLFLRSNIKYEVNIILVSLRRGGKNEEALR